MRISDWSSDVCSSDLAVERDEIGSNRHCERSDAMTTDITAELITLLEHPQDALQRGLEVRRDRPLRAIGVAGDDGFELLDMLAQRSQREPRRDEPVSAATRALLLPARADRPAQRVLHFGAPFPG